MKERHENDKFQIYQYLSLAKLSIKATH